MDDKTQRERYRLGFLATVALPDNMFLGGLLITNRLGRPLEFQCTAPVQPNRTQSLLYGPTLEPYVLTELIGRTLVEKASIRPDLVLVDEGKLLPLRESVKIPVSCLDARSAHGITRIGDAGLRCHAEFSRDSIAVEQLRTFLPAEADLQEPFERVRSALNEAIGAARAA